MKSTKWQFSSTKLVSFVILYYIMKKKSGPDQFYKIYYIKFRFDFSVT